MAPRLPVAPTAAPGVGLEVVPADARPDAEAPGVVAEAADATDHGAESALSPSRG